jgi:hypothetical protein
MRSRLTLTTVLVASVVLLAGCLGPIQTATATDTGTDAGDVATRTIAVTGTGAVTAEADLAVIGVTIEARAETASEARDLVATRTDDLLAALREAGLPDDAVTTTRFAVRAEYDYDREGNREPDGFFASHSFQIETAPDDAGRIVDVAVDAAGASVDRVAFTLTDETRDSLRAEALTRAVDAARADADAVAAAADVEVVGLASASVGGSVGPYPIAFDERAADTAGAATTFAPGPVTVSATVSVTYDVA